MAGCIKVNDSQFWSMASWVYDYIIGLIVEHLPVRPPGRLGELLDYSVRSNIRYVSLCDMRDDEHSAFAQAARQAFGEAQVAGLKRFASPDSFPAFMERFAELIQMIEG